MAKVQCPICEKSVPEADINLHLDLQCRGAQESSPPNRATASSGGGGGGRAGPFSAGASASSSASRESPAGGTPRAGRGKRPAPDGQDQRQNGASEKKPRVNPLVANQPLAERSRPATLDAFIGQTDIVGRGSLLRARIEKGEGVGSIILWGPPGSGKTWVRRAVRADHRTLARLIARTANADFKELSATSAGAADVRLVFEQAKNGLKLTGRRTILMVDEIHRFNRAQQDLFLPYVENGWVQLIGATTENPSFKVNGALLSRCQVFTLHAHQKEDLETILANALAAVPEPRPMLPDSLIPFLADIADGDARQALNSLELALNVCAEEAEPGGGGAGDTGAASDTSAPASPSDPGAAERRAARDAALLEAVRRGLRKGYNRTGEERYDLISAMHKSIRGGDGSAAMLWLARMLEGGEDPVYVARRLVVVASEDIGLGDPHALPLAVATMQATQLIGLPECRINLAHCVAYLSEAPKSTRAYTAYNRAQALATATPMPAVPLVVRNHPTRLMRSLGYGRGYAYNPDYAHPTWNEYLPPELAARSSLAPATPAEHILRSPAHEAAAKVWDDARLAEWEAHANGGRPWEGRARRARFAAAASVKREPGPQRFDHLGV